MTHRCLLYREIIVQICHAAQTGQTRPDGSTSRQSRLHLQTWLIEPRSHERDERDKLKGRLDGSAGPHNTAMRRIRPILYKIRQKRPWEDMAKDEWATDKASGISSSTVEPFNTHADMEGRRVGIDRVSVALQVAAASAASWLTAPMEKAWAHV